MSYNFESIEKFNNSLKEIKFLIGKIKDSEFNVFEGNIYLKSALLLLVGKFEIFLEESIQDFIQNINNLNLSNEKIPQVLKVNHISNLMTEKKIIDKMNNDCKYDDICQDFTELTELFVPQNSFLIKISIKFNYGKHGSKEIEKLFRRIGIIGIFDEIEIFDYKDSYLDGTEKTKIEFKETIDGVTNIRNNILHQDANISTTSLDLSAYCKYFEQFSFKLIGKLEEKLDGIAGNLQIL